MSRNNNRFDADQRPVKRNRHSDAKTDAHSDVAAALKLVDAHDSDVALRALRASAGIKIAPSPGGSGPDLGPVPATAPGPHVAAYFAARARLVEHEVALAFDSRCRARATDLERRVDAIIRRIRRRDAFRVYRPAKPRAGHAGQLHPRFAGDHFLSNVDLINQTELFRVVSNMPKGAHLHIHFNACLPPTVLLDIAKGMERMFITSNLPLIPDGDFENYDKCEIQFSIMSPEREKPGSLFSADYKPRQTMKLSTFLETFPQYYPRTNVNQWLLNKLLFEEQEAHGFLQTAAGAWEKFNGRTRMMKGLFNYESAYRKYTRLCMQDFARDNIQYAEIRPNFMTSNQLYRDDGTGPIDNWGIMDIIIAEVESFQADMASQGRFFGGLKVIYCTPRSLQPAQVRAALDECLQFKQKWPSWIAGIKGFDLVGEESQGKPIKAFIRELLDFKTNCSDAGLNIPFLFHCGETLDTGTETDGNLIDALLLGAKRIGHGFALARHPYVMQRMKARGVCLELCPISNEILGLTPRVSGHAMYQLLANNVHCTVSSDNGTLFRSSLSHDFYQVMVGKADMGLYGWKQLVLWSLEHACLDDAERAVMLREWEILWEKFLQWVVEEYGTDESELEDDAE